MNLKSSLEESLENKRSLECKKIIFVEVVYVLYVGGMNDKAHTAREKDERKALRTLPFFASKLTSGQLDAYKKDDLSTFLGFDREAIQNLAHLCESNNAKIVISQNWGAKKELQQMRDLFSLNELGKYIVDCIESVDKSRETKFVEQWLNAHQGEVESYIILGGRDFGSALSKRFGERYIYCKNLFKQDELNDATAVLNNPLSIENRV